MGTKNEGFHQDPNEEISRNQIFRVREASCSCYYASRGRGLPTLDYFHSKGCLALVSALRGCLVEF